MQNKEVDINGLCKVLKKKNVLVAMEATGGYEILLVKMLETETSKKRRDDQGILSTPEVQGKGIERSDRGVYEKVDNDPEPTDQDRPAMDNKMSILSLYSTRSR